MKNITLFGKLKKVGNSLALFIPAETKKELNLSENQEVAVELHKKKNKNELFGLYGSLKGKNIIWNCREDRYDRV
jgi:antitoxin component of MazEF toxin-antitoxin module